VTVKTIDIMLRIFVLSMLSVVLVPVYWLTTQFVTPGVVIANRIVASQPEKGGLGYLEEGLTIGLVVDFAVWFAALWAGLNLWTEFIGELQEQGATRHCMNPLQHTRSLVQAALCALPLSFYSVIGVAKIFNRKRLIESWLGFLSTVSLSLALCTAGICGLFVIAVRFWPRSR
jgi:hypothetical protein